MKNPPGKAEFLEQIRLSRAELDEVINQLDPKSMTTPGVAGDWSVKDILAHVTWHEREMLNLVKAHALVGSDLWNLPLDQRNEAIYQENKNKVLKDVLAESKAVYESMMREMQTLSEEDLKDPARFADMPSDWQPWDLIAQNTYEHYQDHLADLRAWKKNNVH